MTVLWERDAEQALLVEALGAATDGEGAVVVVAGKAGAGTTSMLEQFAATAARRGCRVLRASGAEAERALSLGVVRQLALPLLAGRDEAVLPDSRAILTGLVDPRHGTPPPALSSVVDGLHALLVGLSAAGTVVVLVDDLHAVDDRSRRVIAALASRVRRRILLVVGVQDGAGATDPLVQEIVAVATRRIRIEPLSAAAVVELVRARFGAGCDPEFARVCFEITAGSPKETHVLLDRASACRCTGAARDVTRLRELGDTLRGERLALLLRRDPAAEAVAKAVTVLGARARRTLVEQLAQVGKAGYAAAWRALRGTWLTTRPDGTLAAEPDLVRSVGRSTPAGETESLHRAAARLLAAHAYSPEDVAAQLLEGGVVRGDWEIDQLRSAAVAARRCGATERSLRYLRRALLDLPPDDGRRPRLTAELGRAELDDNPRSAVRHLVQAAQTMTGVLERASAVASLPLAAARIPPVVHLVRDLAGRLGPAEGLHGDDRDLALRLEARHRYARLEEPGVGAEAARLLRGSTDLSPGSGAAERELRAVLLLAATLTGSLRWDEAARHGAVILDHEPAQSLRTRALLEIVPLVMTMADGAEQALPWLYAARAHAEQHAHPIRLTELDTQLALALVGTGRVAEAREHAVRALDSPALAVCRHAHVSPMVAAGAVATELGDGVLAERVLDESVVERDLLGRLTVRTTLLAHLAARRGDHGTALAHMLDCGRRLEQAGWSNPAVHPWQSVAAVQAHRLGRRAEAVRLAGENHDRASAWGAPSTVGRAMGVLAVARDDGGTVPGLRAAIEVLETAQNRGECAKACIELAGRLRPTDPREADLLHLRARRLAATGGLPSFGRHPQPGADAAGNRDGNSDGSGVLTRREAAVVHLAARGRSNAEIADELEVSRRAVEKHLTNSYRKLQVGGRSGLMEVLGGTPTG